MEFFKANIVPGEVFVQLAAFLIVFFTLKKMAWQPILSALAHRRETIQKSFEQIESAKKEIEAMKTLYENHLQKIEDETRAKVQEAVEEGRRVGREIQEKARSESQASFDKAKENLAVEIAKARLELRREIADLAVSTSEKILKEKLTLDQTQNAKILEIVEELEKTL